MDEEYRDDHEDAEPAHGEPDPRELGGGMTEEIEQPGHRDERDDHENRHVRLDRGVDHPPDVHIGTRTGRTKKAVETELYQDTDTHAMRVSVIGGGRTTAAEYETAVTLGTELGSRGHDVVCGGLSGVMEGVAKGMHETGGQVIGILPGEETAAANQFVDVPIATGLGNARNVLVVLNGDATIAVDGATGTLSEIGHALDFGRPVAGLDTHAISGVEAVETPREAVDYVESATE